MNEIFSPQSTAVDGMALGQRIVDALKAEKDRHWEELGKFVEANRAKERASKRGREKVNENPDHVRYQGILLGQLVTIMDAIGIAETVLAEEMQSRSTAEVPAETPAY